MKIKNWSKFQHFKDRRPPWVKLYRDILDDMEWHELDPLASKVLVMCWLIASEDDGSLPNVKTLAFRLRMTEKQTIDCISKLSHWLEQPDNDVISTRYQDDLPETERETEKEKEKKATKVATPEGVSESVWKDFVAMRKAQRAEITNTALEGLIREAGKAKMTLEQVLRVCCERGWRGFKADWMAGQAVRVNPQDVARVTTPTPDHAFDALRKIEADRKKAVPMPTNIREQLNGMRKMPDGKKESIGNV